MTSPCTPKWGLGKGWERRCKQTRNLGLNWGRGGGEGRGRRRGAAGSKLGIYIYISFTSKNSKLQKG